MPTELMAIQLKETSQLTGALWAAWLEFSSNRWNLRAAYKINRQQSKSLFDYLSDSAVKSWLNGAIAGRHYRARPIPSKAKLTGKNMFVFPDPATRRVIVVGANELPVVARRFWRVVALGNSEQAIFPLPPAREAGEFDLHIPYYFPKALDQILDAVLTAINYQEGWLAIRSGDVFEIKAAANHDDAVGKRLAIEANPLLREISHSHPVRSITRGELEWAMVPRPGLRQSTRHWIGLPLVIGQRLIGLIALWSDDPFSRTDVEQLKQICQKVSPSVEASVTFADVTSHLQRMAMLNDFAMTVSSAFDLEQIAQRVFALLQRAFTTERILLFVLSSDGRTYHHYFDRDGKVVLQTQSMDSDPMHWPMERGEVFRIESLEGNQAYQPVYDGSRSALLVPLIYRHQLIGALGLESVQENAFSIYDEHLMVVIASHLAGLIENGRLRQETEERARNLGLVHEVVQQVIGLTDVRQVAQIAAELLARNFSYEMAVVLLYDQPGGELNVTGIGGNAADIVQKGLEYMDSTRQGGITTRVAVTGESMLVNDVKKDPFYLAIPGWDAGSEMCVALRVGDQIEGVIDVECQSPNAFSQNDLLLLEALAGILSNVISSVAQYEKLQATVNQLQVAREELQERVTAQRVAESRLVQAAKLVAVGEMAAGIAHELNNPLTTVTGFVELVLNELPKDSTSHDDLELVLKEANRARGVVRRLLDFARQNESTRVRTDLNEIVADVMALVNHLLHTSNVEVTQRFGDRLPWISVDRNQLKQVILNLIHNALHAMPGGGHLTIATERKRRDKRDWLTCCIRDTGVGIPPENLERVFEPFFTTRSKEGGTGLGLSVSYGIVADHGGFIEVESRVGKGSAFTVWLPMEME